MRHRIFVRSQKHNYISQLFKNYARYLTSPRHGPKWTYCDDRRGSLERDAKLAQLATLAGCSPLPMDDKQPADFLLIDLYSETDRLGDTVSRITLYLQTYRSTALIWSKMESLEVIYAALPFGQCHFLVDARRVFIELSAETSAKMDDYFAAIGARFSPII
jgi:hypothetical protein